MLNEPQPATPGLDMKQLAAAIEAAIRNSGECAVSVNTGQQLIPASMVAEIVVPVVANYRPTRIITAGAVPQWVQPIAKVVFNYIRGWLPLMINEQSVKDDLAAAITAAVPTDAEAAVRLVEAMKAGMLYGTGDGRTLSFDAESGKWFVGGWQVAESGKGFYASLALALAAVDGEAAEGANNATH